MTTISRNARGQITIDGVPDFLCGLYLPGLDGPGGSQDMVGLCAKYNLGRFVDKLQLIVNVKSGTAENGIRLCQALAPYRMRTLGIANSFGINQVPPSANFDLVQNPNNFRARFAAEPQAFGSYVTDEPTFDPAQRTAMLANIVGWHTTLKTAMPGLLTVGVLLGPAVDQLIEWSPSAIPDVIGCDCYTEGQGSEDYPGGPPNPGDPVSTYGYSNYEWAEACALGYQHARAWNRVPLSVLGLLKFGAKSRFMTTSERFSQAIVMLAEQRARGMTLWWGDGSQNGTLNEEVWSPAQSGNGVNRVFSVQCYVEEAQDVWVDVGGMRQPPSSYTIQGLGNLNGPWSITFKSTWPAPPAGASNVIVTARRWPTLKRNVALNDLDTMTSLIRDLKPYLLHDDDPALISGNSTWMADPLTWRKAFVNLLRNGGPIHLRPAWNYWGGVDRYQREWDKMNLATPDLSMGAHMLDQKGWVRTTAWPSPAGERRRILVAAHNVHPDAQGNVTLTCARPIVRVEVLGKHCDVPVEADGRSWKWTYGGASSKRQGPFDQAALFMLTEADPTDPPVNLTIPLSAAEALAYALGDS